MHSQLIKPLKMGYRVGELDSLPKDASFFWALNYTKGPTKGGIGTWTVASL